MEKHLKEIIEMVERDRISPGDRERLSQALARGRGRHEGIFTGFQETEHPFSGGEPVPVSPDEKHPGNLMVDAGEFEEIRVFLPGRYDLEFSREESPVSKLLISGESREDLEAFRVGSALVLQSMGEMAHPVGALSLKIAGPGPLPAYIFQGDGHFRGESLSGRLTFKSRSCKVQVYDVDDGDIWVYTVDGDVEVGNCQGELTLISVSGDVRAVDVEGTLRMSCSSGDISLENAQGKMKLMNCSGDVEGENLEGNLQVVSASGDLEFCDVEGVIRMETHSGDIGLENAMGCFRISTTSGDVECEKITVEEAEVRSISGDIEVEVEHLEEDAPLSLLTNNGSIELLLPEDGHGRLEAESLQGKVSLKGKVHREELHEENRLEVLLQDPEKVDVPEITVKTYTGNVKIRV